MGNGFDGKIQTLRFISTDADDEKWIESLNLHNSVKSVTVSQFSRLYGWQISKTMILDLLLKKHYFHLDNLNILLDVRDNY